MYWWNTCVELYCLLGIDNSGTFENGVKYVIHCKDLFKYNLDVLFVSLPNYLTAAATIDGIKNGCHVFNKILQLYDFKFTDNKLKLVIKDQKLKK